MRIEPVSALDGHVAVPGDKSISHRAVLIGALCDGETRVSGFGRSADTEATIAAVRALGAEVIEEDVDTLRVRGAGLRGLQAPADAIDCGNAGTLMRLLAGVLAGQEGRTELVGDSSLSSRPMERIAEPLRRMGATVETTEGHAPLVVQGAPLRAIDYELPVASAQVKSAILLAGVQAAGATTVVEPVATRDHTERMLEHAGARVTRRPSSVTVEGAESLRLPDVEVPGDISSAAPFLVAAAIVPGSAVTVHGVGLNPRRAGLLDVLERMGVRIAIYNRRSIGGEPAGDVEVRASELVGTTVTAEEVPSLIDELPIFAVAACHARGETVVRGAEELRAKESNRIEAVVEELRRVGGHIRATRRRIPDQGRPGAASRGRRRLAGETIDWPCSGRSWGSPRARASSSAGRRRPSTSFPGFFDVLEQVAPGAVHYPPAT